MPKPRYDDEKNETRHAAATEEDCDTMAENHGWDLKRVEPAPASVLSIDCVFDDYCEFPAVGMDLSQGDYSKEVKDDA